MELGEAAKEAVRELGDAINRAVERSAPVAEAIDALRELGYEPNLSLKLEIGLMEIRGGENSLEDFHEDVELKLTDEDVQTLRRMKIRFE